MRRGSMFPIRPIFHNTHGTITSAAAKQPRDSKIGGGVGLPSGKHNQRKKDIVLLLWMVDAQQTAFRKIAIDGR